MIDEYGAYEALSADPPLTPAEYDERTARHARAVILDVYTGGQIAALATDCTDAAALEAFAAALEAEILGSLAMADTVTSWSRCYAGLDRRMSVREGSSVRIVAEVKKHAKGNGVRVILDRAKATGVVFALIDLVTPNENPELPWEFRGVLWNSKHDSMAAAARSLISGVRKEWPGGPEVADRSIEYLEKAGREGAFAETLADVAEVILRREEADRDMLQASADNAANGGLHQVIHALRNERDAAVKVATENDPRTRELLTGVYATCDRRTEEREVALRRARRAEDRVAELGARCGERGEL